MCVYVWYECFAYMYVCAPYVLGALRGHGTELKDGCEPPCGCWEPSPHLEEPQTFLTTEPSQKKIIFSSLSYTMSERQVFKPFCKYITLKYYARIHGNSLP